MFTQADVDMIALELPSAAIGQIASKAGVSKPTVYRFFQGIKVRPDSQERIYLAALKVIQKEKARIRRIREKRAGVLNQKPENTWM